MKGSAMKFFIPMADSPEEATRVYAGIKKFLGENLGATFSDRKVRVLEWRHDGVDYTAEVGKPTDFNGELVIAILDQPVPHEANRHLYHVCTPTRGVRGGISILVGHPLKVLDFDP